MLISARADLRVASTVTWLFSDISHSLTATTAIVHHRGAHAPLSQNESMIVSFLPHSRPVPLRLLDEAQILRREVLFNSVIGDLWIVEDLQVGGCMA